MDDLVERLRRKIVAMNGRYVDPADRDKWYKDAYVNPDGPEAADRIEKLEAVVRFAHDTLVEQQIASCLREWARAGGAADAVSAIVNKTRATITSSAR